MLIITADDYGKTKHATDSILECFSGKRVTSASAMVFMEDSERAAALAFESNLEVGLHLNFTEPFSANIPLELREHHNKVASYLIGSHLAQVVHNPFLTQSFKFLFRVQQEEFVRLYGKPPDFINGHHHMHLCANLLLSNIIPKNSRVRGTFTFNRGEKSVFNLFYRDILNFWISRRYISPDCFFSIVPFQNHERLTHLVSLAEKKSIEIEVHPENAGEINFLLSDQCKRLFEPATYGSFRSLSH